MGDEALSQAVFGSRIRYLREGLGLTQDDVAHALDLGPADVAAIEGGTRSVNGIELEQLAYVLCRDMRELVADELRSASPVARLPSESNEAMRARVATERQVRELEAMLGVEAGVKSLRALAAEAHERGLITRRKWLALVRR